MLTMAPIEDRPLSPTERQSLRHYEAIIKHGLKTFVDVGNALLAILNGRLYREEYATFEEYCRERWGFIGRRARQLMSAAKAVAQIEESGTVVPLPANEAQARPLTALPPDQQVEVWQRAVETAPEGKVTAAHVQSVVDDVTAPAGQDTVGPIPISHRHDYDGDEWYTPPKYVEAARAVMGDVDLDPASCAEAQEMIRADAYYTKEDDGLVRPWIGCVWLNPPYSDPEPFVERLLDRYDAGDVTEAVVLVNNATETTWFQSLLGQFPACFVRRRVHFWRPGHDGTTGGQQGQVVFYLGPNVEGFRAEFSHFGVVVATLGPRALDRAVQYGAPGLRAATTCWEAHLPRAQDT